MPGVAFRLRDDRLPFPALQELARLAESRGYDTIFTPEGGGRDVFVTLAALAAATSRVRLSPGIASIFTRTPAVLAAAAVTLDQLSGGRAILGLGTGHAESLSAGHGMKFERPLARTRDTVLLIKSVLLGDATPPATEVLPIQRLRLGTEARPDLPVYIAALGPKMCRLAGEIADGVILNWATAAYAAEAVANVRAGALQAGRDPMNIEIAMYLRVAPGSADDKTWAALAQDIASYASLPFYRAMMDAEGFAASTSKAAALHPNDPEAAGRAIPDEMVEALTAVGADAVRARVGEYQRLGVTLPVLAPLTTRADTFETWQAAINLL